MRSDVVAVLAPSESDFIEELVRILQSIRRLQGTIGKTEPATYVAQFESAVTRLEQLETPPAWIEVKADMAGELRRRLVMMKLLHPTDDAQRVGEDPWLAIEAEFAAKLRERAGFWSGWPVPISRVGRR